MYASALSELAVVSTPLPAAVPPASAISSLALPRITDGLNASSSCTIASYSGAPAPVATGSSTQRVPVSDAARAAVRSVSAPLLISAAVLIHSAPAPAPNRAGQSAAAPIAGAAPTASSTFALRFAAT